MNASGSAADTAGGTRRRRLALIRGVRRGLVRAGRPCRELWQRVRAWRRVRFTSGGLLFTTGAFAVGVAAMNTGNNLLFLLLGAMIGTIVLSGWLSERAVRRLEVRRDAPRGTTAGTSARVLYEVRNRKRRLPSLAIEIREPTLPGSAFVPRVDAGESRIVRSEHRFARRGVHELDVVTLSTAFPFGLFRKERDLSVPGELVVWPRTDRHVPEVSAPAERGGAGGARLAGRSGGRGEYRGLRPYRPGDDPRDIHWRSTARAGEPVIREYERDASPGLWICLDAGAAKGDEGRFEEAVEVAASLAARLERAGERFALAADGRSVQPGGGAGQLERVLDALARVQADPAAPPVRPPVEPDRCVLVSTSGRHAARFGEAVLVGRGGGDVAPDRSSVPAGSS